MPRDMKNDWWFKFEHTLWLTDPDLNKCSLAAQGFWLRCLCMMRKSGTARLTGSPLELCRILSVFPDDLDKCVEELRHTKTADVTKSQETVTLKSRRFHRELNTKEQNRLRKRKEREGKAVTPESQDRVISKSKELKKEEENTQEAGEPSFAEKVLEGIKAELNILQLHNEPMWGIALENAEKNKFSVDHVLETFRLMQAQKWRNSPIRPDTLLENLPNIVKLREEIETQNNGRKPDPGRPQPTTETYACTKCFDTGEVSQKSEASISGLVWVPCPDCKSVEIAA